MTRLGARSAAAAIVCCLASAPASAEPIVVSGGFYRMAWDDPDFFEFAGGRGFYLRSGFSVLERSPQRICFHGCLPGAIVDLSATTGSVSYIPRFPLGLASAAIVDDVRFGAPGIFTPDRLNLAGRLQFDAGTIVLPPFAATDMRALDVRTPFVMTGTVAAYARDDTDAANPLFNVDVTGRGHAVIRFWVNGDEYGDVEGRYTFEPVPEPASLLLLSTAVAGLAGRAMRKRRKTTVRR